MWPFSTKMSEERERSEWLASRTELMTKVTEQLRDLDQRFKVIEREHEDLHRAYRRLRSQTAVEAREAPRNRPVRDPGGNGEAIPAPLTKDELRKKFLTPKIDKRVDSD
jgi:hypothetical protein